VHVLNIAITDESNGNVYPQAEHMGAGYDWDAPDSVTQIGSAAAVGMTPRLRSFHLDPATRWTDIITQGYIPTSGLLVSERLDDLLVGFRRQGSLRWPAEVVLNGSARTYYWLDMNESIDARIDWLASRFEFRAGSVREERTFASAAELATAARKLVDDLSGKLLPLSIALRTDAPLDLFVLALTWRTYLVSDPLAARLVEAGMTGFRLERCPG
jgi:hypothetical protein